MESAKKDKAPQNFANSKTSSQAQWTRAVQNPKSTLLLMEWKLHQMLTTMPQGAQVLHRNTQEGKAVTILYHSSIFFQDWESTARASSAPFNPLKNQASAVSASRRLQRSLDRSSGSPDSGGGGGGGGGGTSGQHYNCIAEPIVFASLFAFVLQYHFGHIESTDLCIYNI